MRNHFQHHIPLSPADIDQIWNTAFLTVDANVLLDLYRYHITTREKLLDALAEFRGRLWLSYQVADEFFKNRHTVIASALGEFDVAEEQLKLLDKALSGTVDKLRGVRPISRDLAETLNTEIRTRIETARSSVRESRAAHPNYFLEDPVLNKTLDLFDKVLGPQPSMEDWSRLEQEAKRRIEEKIPPGFMDGSKDEGRAVGDYVLWSQILEHAKLAQIPFILVTAEKKEDWWEKLQGRRVGPRVELIREALSFAGQRFLLYERDHFLTEIAARRGLKVEKSVLRDVRQLAMQWHAAPTSTSSGHGPATDTVDLEPLAETVVERFASRLVDNDDVITALIAETNASGFGLDELVILDVGPLDLDSVSFQFRARAHFAGEQHEDRMAYGDSISAEISGTLEFDGSEWHVADYAIDAEIEHDDRDDGYEEEPQGPEPE